MMREIFDYVLSLLRSRLLPLALVFTLMVGILVNRLFTLQIINGESYMTNLSDSIKKTTSVAATRGRIFDRNGVLLAYNDLAFAVKISDSGIYKDNETKNAAVNNAIEKTLQIIESKGDSYYNNFQIEYAGNNGEEDMFEYTVSGMPLLRFQRDSYGKATIGELTDEEKASTANQMVDFECERYGIDRDSCSPEHLLEIISLRLSMSANSYNRYMAFTIANEVSDETVAAILENSGELVGVTVEEQYIRRYVDSVYCSQILGYTGTISSSELEDLKAKNDSYEANDVVGKTGIEQSMELELSGKKGSRTVYVDTVGRITEVLNETEAVAGNDVYLTIDINWQKAIYEAIENELVSIIRNNMTNGDTKYTYNSSGDVSAIYITAKEIYFALIDNNIVSLDKIAAGEHENERNIYSAFQQKKGATMSWLHAELTDSPTEYGKLSEENQAYIWYIYKDLLRAENIFNSDNVDVNDSVYRNWNDGNSTSLEELLKYAIAKNWIDMTTLTTQQYTSLQESYDALLEYIFNALETDTDFHKKMYKYLVESGSISGRQVCMLLFEQGVLDSDDDYQSLVSGRQSAYDFISKAIETKTITPAQLALRPCSGSCVIVDPNNGDVLALVSYPSYDNNRLSGSVDAEYYRQLNSDKSTPLYNWATQSQTAPGSTFKICSAITAMDTGLISAGSTYYCSGAFTKVTPNPRCWQLYGHGSETVPTAIRDSCNVYFYNVGYELACSSNGRYNSTYGTSLLQKYAEQLGLATLSGIEIPEKAPSASNTNAITSAIGQGSHLYSCLNLARYVSTIANSGTCYNLTLVDKITDSDGNLVRDNQAEAANQMQLSASTWNAVHSGMIMAGSSYVSLSRMNLSIAAKSGTAQENKKEPDHSLLISYAPYNAPEVAMAVSIPNGYTSNTSIDLMAEVYKIYYGIE